MRCCPRRGVRVALGAAVGIALGLANGTALGLANGTALGVAKGPAGARLGVYSSIVRACYELHQKWGAAL